jgi:hypothetical protein
VAKAPRKSVMKNIRVDMNDKGKVTPAEEPKNTAEREITKSVMD